MKTTASSYGLGWCRRWLWKAAAPPPHQTQRGSGACVLTIWLKFSRSLLAKFWRCENESSRKGCCHWRLMESLCFLCKESVLKLTQFEVCCLRSHQSSNQFHPQYIHHFFITASLHNWTSENNNELRSTVQSMKRPKKERNSPNLTDHSTQHKKKQHK